jgi:hypothetical protein
VPDASSIAAPLAAACDLLPVRTMTKGEWQRLTGLVKDDLAAALSAHAVRHHPEMTVKGRTGRAVAWAHVPWVGIHDPRVDSGGRTGVYVALLLRVDGSGAVLSVQVGSDSRTADELARTVEAVQTGIDVPDGCRAAVPTLIPPSLRAEYDRSLAPYRYERASVCAQAVGRDAMRDSAFDSRFGEALHCLLRAYTDWAAQHDVPRGGAP